MYERCGCLPGRSLSLPTLQKVFDVSGKVLGFSELFNVELKDDNLKAYDTLWEETIEKELDHEFLESLRQFKHSAAIEEC